MISRDETASDTEQNLPPSKSQMKRDMQRLQDLAGQLLTLGDGELERLGFDDGLIQALAETRRMKASGARNRQIKHLAKLLSREDVSQAISYLGDQQTLQAEANRFFHGLEKWRDRLIHEKDQALGQLLAEHPQLNRQQLRQLMRNATREAETGKPVGAGKKLFRFLREQLGQKY